MELYLEDHSDSNFVHLLMNGFKGGFDTGLQYLPPKSYTCKNLQSAWEFHEYIPDLIKDELEKGYLIGPYAIPPFSTFRINPLGVAQGKYPPHKMFNCGYVFTSWFGGYQ